MLILTKRFKVKCWDSFQVPKKFPKQLYKNGSKVKTIFSQAQATPPFLAQWSYAQAQLATAKTEEEYFAIMEQLLQSRSQSSQIDVESDPEELIIVFINDNKEDYFGILPLIHQQ